MTRSDETFEIVVDVEPRKAGIDPFNKLIDRDPDDNLVSVAAGTEGQPPPARATVLPAP